MHAARPTISRRRLGIFQIRHLVSNTALAYRVESSATRKSHLEVSLDSQEIGVADKITDPGDGNDSGILSLSYPALTSAHPGSNYSNASLSFFENRIIYSPLFTSLYTSRLIDPYFGLALDRPAVNVSNGSGGTLSLGTLPTSPTSALSQRHLLR